MKKSDEHGTFPFECLEVKWSLVPQVVLLFEWRSMENVSVVVVELCTFCQRQVFQRIWCVLAKVLGCIGTFSNMGLFEEYASLDGAEWEQRILAFVPKMK